MRILVATDAFRPQVNGVVRSLESIAATLPSYGSEIEFLHPAMFRTVACPTYREIRLALTGIRGVAARIQAIERRAGTIDHVHIATEGPIGLATRRYCLQRRRPFTTSYHTRFPEYVAARSPVPVGLTYRILRWFHNAADGTMVSTPSLAEELEGWGFAHLSRWSRGVDANRFNPAKRDTTWQLPRPIFLYAGRLAPEKDVGAFLDLDLPGSKIVVGDGPSAESLRAAHPQAHFLGVQYGEDLARTYASSDVFVFPSRTDTFGIVLLEAMASGLPVAAFPVTGPIDVIGNSGAGVLDSDLRQACLAALDIPPERPRQHAERYGWDRSAKQFLDNIIAARAAFAQKQSASRKQGELLRQGKLIKP